jgi:peptide/nickel transport system permease protein
MIRQLRKDKAAMLGLVLVVLIVAAALLAPVIAPYDPLDISHERFQPPGRDFLFGTDELGRDLLSRIIYGARISLRVGLISVGIAAAIGVQLGLVSGYFGEAVDNVISRAMDILLAFPSILLAIIIVAILGPGLDNAMIAIGLASIPTYARLVRGSTLCEREKDYVLAARAIGVRSGRLLFRHILPNIVAPVIVFGTLGVATAILAAAGLSFIGLGAQPPTPEWGAMLSQGRNYLRTEWWVPTFPGLAIVITVLGINLLGDGLRDALDPQLRNGRG